jgi:ribonuclease HI
MERTGSEYLVKSIKKWMPNWKDNGWKSLTGDKARETLSWKIRKSRYSRPCINDRET